MEIDLEEELNRIKLEFDQKFGATGMTFDELPDDLESMLNTYSVGGGSISTNQQPYNDSSSRGQSYAYDFEYESPRQQQQQQPARAQARPAPTPQPVQQQPSRNNTQNFGGGGGGVQKAPSTTQPLQKAPSQPIVQKSQSQVLKAKQAEEEQYRIQAELDLELDRYLEEEGFVDDGYAETDEFDDALPPLEDMLLLITNPKIHEKYNYQLPKRIPYAMQQQMLEKQQEQAQRLAMEQANRSAMNRAQPFVQQQQPVQRNVIEADPLPDLAQPAWSVRDCNTLVQYLKKLLMGVLQDALVVKKMDLTDNYNMPQAESIFKKTGNSLKEAREIIEVIARIDTQDGNHLDIQASVQALSDTMIKSTVVMLRTAMNVTKGIAVVDQFANAYAPFFNDARALISEVNVLAFDTWGPNEVFFA